MAKRGRHSRRRGPGGPSRPARPGRVTPPSSSASGGVTFRGPSIDGLVGSLLDMARQAVPPGARGRALGLELWADQMAASLYGPEAMPREFYAELADGLVASTDPDAPAVLAALATALDHGDARALRAVQGGAADRRRGEASPRADATLGPDATPGPDASPGTDGSPEPDDDLGIGRATPTGARVVEHVTGDGTTVVVDFDQPGAAHSLSAEVDHNLLGAAADLSVGPPWDEQEGVGELRADPDTTVTEISLAEARARVEHALELTDHSPGAPVSADMADLRRLVERRLALLPRGGDVPARPTVAEDEMDALVEGFLASPEAGTLPAAARDEAAWIAELWIDHAVTGTVGGPLRVSEALVEQFCAEGLDEVEVDRATRAATPAVLAAWIRHAARLTGLRDQWRDEALAALARCAPTLGPAPGDGAGGGR